MAEAIEPWCFKGKDFHPNQVATTIFPFQPSSNDIEPAIF